jgi:hypothetical protein
MTMSHKAPQDPDLRRAPTQKLKTQEDPNTGLPPADDGGVIPDDTGKPGAPPK